MKIIVIGGTGVLGQGVVTELASRHSLVIASHSQNDLKVDISSPDSIEDLFKTVGEFDALVCTAGIVHFGDFNKLTAKEHMTGINNKLLGQMNLVHIGLKYVNNHGSFTLTSGNLSHDPIRHGCSASMINSAIEGFVRGAAIEMQRGIRINAVSPTLLTESLSEFSSLFRGTETVSSTRAALAFTKSVEGLQTGQVYRVGW